jgi:hypothetical protein
MGFETSVEKRERDFGSKGKIVLQDLMTFQKNANEFSEWRSRLKDVMLFVGYTSKEEFERYNSVLKNEYSKADGDVVDSTFQYAQKRVKDMTTKMAQVIEDLKILKMSINSIDLLDSIYELTKQIRAELELAKSTNERENPKTDAACAVLGSLVIMLGVVTMEFPPLGATLITLGASQIGLGAHGTDWSNSKNIKRLQDMIERLNLQKAMISECLDFFEPFLLSVSELLSLQYKGLKSLEEDFKKRSPHWKDDWHQIYTRYRLTCVPGCNEFKIYLDKN